MSTNYEITYSDGSLQFIVSPYSANGPISPSGAALYPGAIKADTSLTIVGKGAEGYGERLQENMVHLLEHFFSETEPTYPTGGQIWYDRSEENGDVPRLKIFNSKKYINISPIESEIWIDGDLTARYGTGGGKVSKIRIFEPVVFTKEDYDISGIVYESIGKRTKISISNQKGIRTSWYIGGWDDLLVSSDGTGSGITNALSSRIINVETDSSHPKDAVNVETLTAAFQSSPIPLSNLSDVDMGTTVHNDVLHFDSSNNKWTNINLSEALQEEGDISFGGDLNLNRNTIYGFGEDMDLNYKKIVNVGYPDEFDPSKEFHAVNVGYFLKKMPGGGDNGVSFMKHLSDVNSNLTPSSNEFLYFDGAEWTNLSIANVGNILSFVPLSGTNLGTGDPPYNLDKNALIHYNPTSDFHTGDANIREKVGNYGLITLGMGDVLWGSSGDTKVQFGNYLPESNELVLGWGQYSPQYPLIPGHTEPENPDGVRFEMDIYEAVHRSFDPKNAATDGLYFEKSLSRTIDTYPYIPLNEIVHVVNQSLGDITSFPFKGMYDGSDINGTPQLLGANYLVGKSNLEIYKDGIKQYASLKNWVKSKLEADGSGNTGERTYLIESAHIATSTINDFGYYRVHGDETIRFNELAKLGQTISIVDNSDNTIKSNISIDPVNGAHYDAGLGLTYIYLTDDPNWDGKPPNEYFIKVINEYNVGGKVWGGYPTGLDITRIYTFKLTVDGTTVYPTVIGSNTLNPVISKNIIQIVDDINSWSMDNSSRFSAYLEGGSIYFTASESGNISISVENDISGTTAFPSKDIDAVYDNPETPGAGMAFDTNSDVTDIFLPGLKFDVINSPDGNDGEYHVLDVELLAGNITRIFVEESIIPSTTPGGDMQITPLSLFSSIVGGETYDGSNYHYNFSDPTGWDKKSDETDLIFDGDYNEYGMSSFLSNTITWNNAPTSGDKIEIIIQNAVQIE